MNVTKRSQNHCGLICILLTLVGCVSINNDDRADCFCEVCKEIYQREEALSATGKIGRFDERGERTTTYFYVVLQSKVLGDGGALSLGGKAGRALADAVDRQTSFESKRLAARSILVRSMERYGAIDSAVALDVPGLGTVFSREEWTELVHAKQARKSWLFVWRNSDKP